MNSPGPGFTKMPATTRADGLPDGIHCGGVWLSPTDEVYKPLDCKPFANATERVPTNEDQCLEAFSGQPGFLPRDAWRVEAVGDRRWLILPRLYFWPQNRDLLMRPTLDHLLLIESAVRAMNAAGWEYGDVPQLAYTEDGDPLLMDFSAAHKPKKWSHNWHGDQYRMARWWEDMGRKDISALRMRGGHVHHAVRNPEFCDKENEPFDVLDRFWKHTKEQREAHQFIYASTNRPMSPMWAKIPGVVFLHSDPAKFPRVHTWLASARELDAETLQQYELSIAHLPWA